jgi:hypothetical protein
MSFETGTVRLLKTLYGLYRPLGWEVERLAWLSRLNKVYLAYLRRVGSPDGELLREESRYGWFVENTVEVVGALGGVDYALFKFRRPVEHVSVDLDVLVSGGCVGRAVRALKSIGFEVVVSEPYTVTLSRRGFTVDLYTQPSFAWTVYLDGGRLLREHREELELRDSRAYGLTREAEVVVAAAHAVYKEHMVLLLDCITAWTWTNKRTWGIALELRVQRALEELLKACNMIREGLAKAPYKLKPHVILKAYTEKIVGDPVFRATTPNMLRYITTCRAGAQILSRLRRRSY